MRVDARPSPQVGGAVETRVVVRVVSGREWDHSPWCTVTTTSSVRASPRPCPFDLIPCSRLWSFGPGHRRGHFQRKMTETPPTYL